MKKAALFLLGIGSLVAVSVYAQTTAQNTQEPVPVCEPAPCATTDQPVNVVPCCGVETPVTCTPDTVCAPVPCDPAPCEPGC